MINSEGKGEPIVRGQGALLDRKMLRRSRVWRLSGGVLMAMGLFGISGPAMGGGFSSQVELSALDGSNGFALNGINQGDWSGVRVAGAGDVNGDGIEDLIIGAWAADPDGRINAGQGYVVFGTDRGFPAALELSSLDGGNGFALNGMSDFDLTGIGVAGAGDVNGDGIDDLVIGARGANPNGTPDAGQSYVVFGTDQGFPAALELSSLDGGNGFVLRGINAVDRSGFSVAGAGNVNGDGIDDVIIGSKEADSNGKIDNGQSYVVFGTDQGFPAALELSALDGSDGFALDGIRSYDDVGFSVADAGDVNGDGIDDIITGARNADPRGKSKAGQSYVVFGTDQGFPAALELSALDGSNGFRLNGINQGDRSGESVAGAGDVNGDDIDDVIVGARDADPNGKPDAGQSYVVFGTDQGFPAALELSALDGSNGFALNGIGEFDLAGSSVAGAGDVNGDGFDDVVIGARDADPHGKPDAGQSYVVFGTDQGFPAMLELSALDGSNGFALNGINQGDSSGIGVAGAGDVNGDGIDDIVVGAGRAGPDGKAKAGQSYVVFGRSVLELSVSGSCPGEVVIDIAGATPNDSVVFGSAAGRGDFTIGNGVCAGTVLDLDNPVREATLAADLNGQISVAVPAPIESCGKFIQSVDRASCVKSNLARFP